MFLFYYGLAELGCSDEPGVLLGHLGGEVVEFG